MISEFPLFIFTLLGGGAAGAYAAAALFTEKEFEGKKLAMFPLVCLILLGVSGVALLGHLGHPERVFNAFSNINSGITQEGFTMMAFGVVVAIDCLVRLVKSQAVRALKIVGGVCGVLCLCAMANAYFNMLGIDACTTPAVVPFFIVGGLATGFALFGLFMEHPYEKGAFSTASVVIDALLAVAMAAMAAHFSGVGLDLLPMVCGLVIAPVASIVVIAMHWKEPKSWTATAVCALMFVGLAIARFAFYATF